MTALVLIGFLAVAAPTQDWSALLREAEQLTHAQKLDEAMALLGRLIDGIADDAEDDLAIKRQALLRRGNLWHFRKDHQRSRADFAAALALDPTDGVAMLLYAGALEMLGEIEQARQARQAAQSLSRLPLSDFREFTPLTVLPNFGYVWKDARTVWGIAAATLLLLFGTNVWRGNRQRLEGGGTVRRLVAVAALVAALQLAPLMPAVLIASPGQWALGSIATICLLAVLANLWVLGAALGPPVRWLGRSEALPLVDAPGFLTRVAELSAKLGVPTPRVRLLNPRPEAWTRRLASAACRAIPWW